MSVAQDGCMAVVNQALTKMANYDHRLNMMKGRINSAKGWKIEVYKMYEFLIIFVFSYFEL